MSVPPKTQRWLIYLLILIAALAFRLNVAHYLANDDPDDGRAYAQLARNLLEQHVYSANTAPPYNPTLVRLPGYPLFLAGVYAVFGHGNNQAVRYTQAFVDTATCVLLALLAFNWTGDARRRSANAIATFILAALCPFTMIYVATILTETWTNFLLAALALTATYALLAATTRRALLWWSVAGLCAGAAVQMRPDSGLFMAGVGLALVLIVLWPRRPAPVADEADSVVFNAASVAVSWRAKLLRVLTRGAVCACIFALTLAPWAWRNWRRFHVFQPLAPAHAEMPGEFVPHGYYLWLRTWLDDARYIDTMLYPLGDAPIKFKDIPARAFDSPDEQAQVAALLEKYNYPNGRPPNAPASDESDETDEQASNEDEQNDNDNNSDNDNADNDDESEQTDEEQNDQAQREAAANQKQPVQMTPEIDAGFAEIARARIRRAPFRFYVWLPVKRAAALWFDTHSQYYPFSGQLFPLAELDYDAHQQFWLPLFVALTWFYTLLGLAGAWVLWHDRAHAGWRWSLLAALLTLPRLVFLATLENPEPRYTVEIFPILVVLGGIASGTLGSNLYERWRRRSNPSSKTA